jgi:teichoic acid transport system ATP-binding protein
MEFRKKTTDTIAALIESDKTVVIVTHNMSQVMKFCHRVAWIKDGELELVGTPQEILPRYEGFFKRIEQRKSQILC